MAPRTDRGKTRPGRKPASGIAPRSCSGIRNVVVRSSRTLFQIAAIAVTALIVTVGTSRLDALTRADFFTAVGEREWSEWAWRRGAAEPLAGAADRLRSGEPVDLAIFDSFVDDGWWRAMARYYLPSNRINRIEAGPDALKRAHAETVVIVRRGGLEILRER